jgi:hypothetical protein
MVVLTSQNRSANDHPSFSPRSVSSLARLQLTQVCITSRYLSVLPLPSGSRHSAHPESALSVHQQIVVLARDHLTWAFAEATSAIEVVQAMAIMCLWKEPDDDRAGFYFNRVGLVVRRRSC